MKRGLKIYRVEFEGINSLKHYFPQFYSPEPLTETFSVKDQEEAFIDMLSIDLKNTVMMK